MKGAEEGKWETEELDATGLEIAIIGMAGRFPGANNIEEFWDNLKNGVESIGFFPGWELEEAGVERGQLNNPAYVKVGSIMESTDYFDASFFGYTPREAQIMPPQVRIFHRCVWEALEDAGITPGIYGGRIGLYAGASSSTYWEVLTFLEGAEAGSDGFTRFIFTSKDNISTHIAFQLNLRGPAVVVQTACSTSLTAVHLAVQGLLNGESEVALAGGVTVSSNMKGGYLYQEGMIMSKDGHVRAFDANASGVVGGNGAAVVVLKALEDAVSHHDHIYAVIKGSAINNDGMRKVGYTAPSVNGQAEVIKAAQYLAGVTPESIGYIEAHGTATALGDPVEIEALTAAFKTSKRNFCAIGSVKTNVGHLDNAAGVVGLIKAALALYHRFLPPSLHFETPNPHIDFKNTPFYVVTSPGIWKPHDPGYPLRAGVSSFGIGGTNAHVVLEQAPVIGYSSLVNGEKRKEREYQLILLSAKSKTALDKMTGNLAEYFKKNLLNRSNRENPANPGPILTDVAYTLQKGRKTFPYKRMLVCSPNSGVEIAAALLDPSASAIHTHTPSPGEENRDIRVVFMFPGLGSQHIDMGRDLYEHEPLFRSEMDRCFEILQPLLDYNIREILYPSRKSHQSHQSDLSNQSDHSDFSHIEIAQLVVFIFEYALGKLLMHWGIQPDVMIGYSFGEYTAACISGVFSLEDALQLVVRRGQLLKKIPNGVMLSIPLRREELNPLLPGGMTLAIDNGPSCIVAGEPGAAAALEEEMKRQGYLTLRLPVVKAIHSHMMEPVLKEFRQIIAGINRRKPQIPYISNVTGTMITAREACDPEYWVDHLRKTVRFSEGMEKLVRDPGTVLLEVGPGNELTALSARYLEKENRRAINLARPRNKPVSDHYHLLNRLGRLWFLGVPIDWDKLYPEQRPYRVSLPTYPFEEHRYYIDPAVLNKSGVGWTKGVQPRGKNDIAHWFYVPSWKRQDLIREEIGNMPTGACWVVFLDTWGLGEALVKHLEKNGQRVITVRMGEEFKQEKNTQFTLHPDHAYENGYNALFAELCRMEAVPDRIVHLWSVTGPGQAAAVMENERLNQVKNRGYYSLEGIARAIGQQEITREIQLLAISDHLHEVTGEDGIYPEKAIILGQVMVIPTEFVNIKCRSIDLVMPSSSPAGIGSEPGEKLVRQLLDEMQSRANEAVVAYRGGYRWVQCLEPRPLETPGEKFIRFKPGGVYLITGGLGGVGLVMAEYLAKKVGAALILTGRNGLPPREQWEQVTASTPPHEGIGLQIRKVKEIEEMGAGLLVLSADVADPGQMQEVVTRAEQELGPISGIIHCAALTDGQMIQLRTRETSERIFRSKITGTLVLDALFRDRALDFFVLCSSLNSVLPAFGQAGYCAANVFLNTFAQHRNAVGGSGAGARLTVSIAWDRWLGIGSSMIAEKRHLEITGEQLQEGMSGEQGMEAFNRILANSLPQVLISISDISTALKDANRYQGSVLKAQWEKGAALKTAVPRPWLDTPYAAPENNTQQILVNIWSTFFGYESVGIRDDFFELGGDSLKAITLTGMLHKAFNTKITLVNFFNRRTIEELARYITGNEGKDRFSPIEPAEEMEYYHLTSAQKRLYILQRMNPDSTAYNMPTIIPLAMEFDPGKTGETFQGIIKRHESLRTSFHLVNEMPVQVIRDEVEFDLDLNDLQDSHDSQDFIKRFIRPFDLSKPPLIRAGLIKKRDKGCILIVDMHHIIADGVSHHVLGKDFLALHEGEDLPSLRVRYKDFSRWQQGEKEKQSLKQEEKYWLEAFAGEIPVLELPGDYPRPLKQSFAGGNVYFEIPVEETRTLNAVALREGYTLFMVLAAVFNILLSKLSSQEEIIIGTPTAGRRHADLEKIIGMFVNTLALRNYPAADRTFREFLADVKEKTLMAFENQDYPFEELVDRLSLTRDLGRNPLFDIMFVMQNMERAFQDPYKKTQLENQRAVQPGIPGEYENIDLTAKFDLTLTAVETNRGLFLSFQYCTKLFQKETIKEFTNYFKLIASTVVKEPGIRISEIEIVSEEEKNRLLYELNDTGVEYPKEKTIHQLFTQQVEQTPDCLALVGKITKYKLQITNKETPFGQVVNAFGGMLTPDDGSDLTVPPVRFVRPVQLTYRQLNEQCDELAGWLIEKGIHPDTMVGIMVERSVEMIIGILGILKSGGAYLPIDPGYPRERIDYMLKDSGAKILLTGQEIAGLYSPPAFKTRPQDTPFHLHLKPALATSLAYIIYTSGTTGKSKGTLIQHRNVVRLFFNNRFQFDFTGHDVWTMFHSYCFDFSVWEMYGALLYGGKLVIVPKMMTRDPGDFLELLKSRGVTVLNQTPSAFYQLSRQELQAPGRDLLLRYVIFGGEALKPGQLKSWHEKYPEVKLINMYGITETTVHVTYKATGSREIAAGISNIGGPIPTLHCCVLDRGLKLVPRAVPGELYVGGDGVARGYLNRPELTGEKFVPSPYKSGDILYRSGDRVRILPTVGQTGEKSFEMEYLGRVDQQVKIRGYRIEPGEVEQDILAHKGIKDAVVLPWGVGETGADEPYLCAYFVPCEGEDALSAAGLRDYLSGKLPGHMVPAYFMGVDRIPLTPNGKIDRSALPAPRADAGTCWVPPEGETEIRLAQLWSRVLGLEKVGANDNFFVLGGDSIKAIRLISAINKELTIGLKIVDIYTHGTVGRMASLVDHLFVGAAGSWPGQRRKQVQARFRALKDSVLSADNLTPHHEREIQDVYPMTDIEKGIVFYYMKYAGTGVYHDQFVYNINYRDFAIHRCQRVLELLMEKHSILRSGFNLQDFGEPVHLVYGDLIMDFLHIDIKGLSFDSQRERIIDCLAQDLRSPFDITVPPLWRLRLFTGDGDAACMLFSFHHAILDGWSVSSLLVEFDHIYRELAINPSCTPPPLKSSYKDAVIEEIIEKENPNTRDYWQKELAGYRRLDFSRTVKSKGKLEPMKVYRYNGGEQRLAALRETALRHGTTVKNLCFGAYAFFMSMFSHEKDIVVGCVGNNRPVNEDGDKVLGCFLNTVPLRLRIPGELRWGDYIRLVEHKMLEVKKYERLPLFEIAMAVGETSKDRNPFFDTLFNFMDFHILDHFRQVGEKGADSAESGQAFNIDGFQDTNTLFDFEVNITNGELILCPKYNISAVSDEMVQRCCVYFLNILDRFAEAPEAPARFASIMSEEEREQLLHRFNDTAAPYCRDKTMHRLFEEQEGRTPSHSAVIGSGGVFLTYRYLNGAANRLAHRLIERGAGPGVLVAVVMERCPAMIAAVMGILKSGAAYVPLEPYLPGQRICKILDSLGISRAVTGTAARDKMQNLARELPRLEDIFCMESGGGTAGLTDYPPTNPAPSASSRDIAYVIFTSGSTGIPKGVVETHQPVINVLQWVNKTFGVGERDRLLFVASLGFDLSVYDIFGILACGGALRVVDAAGLKDPEKLLNIIIAERITFWDSAPAALQQIVPFMDGIMGTGMSHSLRLVFLSGDWIPVTMPDVLREAFSGVRVISLGGATEATIWSNYYPIDEVDPAWPSIPYGKPIQNAAYYILDRNLEICPTGVPGDLYIGGQCLAVGYVNDVELTAEKFDHDLWDLWDYHDKKAPFGRIINGFGEGEAHELHELAQINKKLLRGVQGGGFLEKSPPGRRRLYRTGDRARWYEDGNMEFLGRIDKQVKIRGFRIELGEVESHLVTHPLVRDGVVVDRVDTGGNKYLCAYYISVVHEVGSLPGDGEIDKESLRQHLLKELPEYMIPAYFIPIDKIPLTANGKLDRRALPEVENIIHPTHTKVLPVNRVQEMLVKIWAGVLGIDKVQIGIDDDFFELGGHSLNATQLIGQIHKELGVKIPLAELFKTPTIAELSPFIKNCPPDEYGDVPGSEKREYYPLSPAQKRLYILQQLDLISTAYNMYQVIPLDGADHDIDMEKLQRIFIRLIQRHESLRTSYFTVNDQPAQKIHEYSELGFAIRYVENGDDFVKPFDLGVVPLLRVGITGAGTHTPVMLIDMHHIISDGTSQVILQKEFIALYLGEELAPARLQYKDFSQWQNSLKQQELLNRQESYWLEVFPDELPVLNLPIDFPRPSVQRFEGAVARFQLDEAGTRTLTTIAAETQITLYMVILSIFSILLSKLSGQEDIILGTPIAGRRHPDLESIIGMFVNTLAMRNFPVMHKTYSQFLKEIKENTIKAFENQGYQFENLVERVSVRRDTSRNPIFDVMVNLLNQADFTDPVMDTNGPPEQRGRHDRIGNAKFDLNLTAIDMGKQLFFSCEYAASLFRPATIERIIDYFKQIVLFLSSSSTGRRSITLAEIEMVPEEEKARILEMSNGPGTSYDNVTTVHMWFQEQAARTPDSVALVGMRPGKSSIPSHQVQLTYRRLNLLANRLARRLRQKGVKANTVVGFMMERSIEMITTMLAVLKAGGAYLPIDNKYPGARKKYMLDNSQIKLLLTNFTLGQESAFVPYPIEIMDITAGNLYSGSDRNLPSINNGTDLVYVIYTSGSTGNPKGVMLEHRNLVNLFAFQFQHTTINCTRMLQFATISFDASFHEIFSALLCGGMLHLVDEETRGNIGALFGFVGRHDIPTVFLPMSFLKLIFNDNQYVRLIPGCIRHIQTAGEQVLINDAFKEYLRRNRVVLHNHYGPSETHVVTTLTIDPTGEIPGRPPIGKPITNTGIYILDRAKHLVPLEVVGELYIGGQQVGRGYLRNETLTRERFTKSPFKEGEQLYRSGDLARLRTDGVIEFLGRVDHQAKIRGFRVEPGEIERHLLNHPDIKETVVSAISLQEAGDTCLCAYIVLNGVVDPMSLRRFLSQQLPDYMVPAYFVPVEKIPLTPGGKIDRKALPVPEVKAGAEYVAPSSRLEKQLVDIWAGVLEVNYHVIGIDSNFFELGGHSLRATILVARVHKALKVTLPLAEVFKTPHVRGLAAYIQKLEKDKYVPIEPVEKKEYYPLSPAQKRQYFLQQLDLTSTAYNMPQLIPLDHEVDMEKLQRIFTRLIQRHESLRTSYFTVNGQPVQEIHEIADIKFALQYYDTGEMSEGGIPPLVKSFDLSQAPLLRVRMLKIGIDCWYLWAEMHHIISDGVSNEILIKDFLELHEGKELQPLRVQYKDFTQWQNGEKEKENLKRQEKYWLKEFEGEIPVLELPIDYPRPVEKSFEGNTVNLDIPGEETRALNTMALKQGSTLFMVLLALVNILLSKLGGQEEIIIGTPIAGRRHTDLEKIIGMFVNTLALKNYPAGERTFREFLADVKEKTLKAFENQEYPFEEVVDKLSMKRDIGRNPLFEIMFLLQKMDTGLMDRDQVSENEISRPVQPGFPGEYENIFQTAKFDLTLTAEERRNGLFLSFQYCTKLFKKETIERFIIYFKKIVSMAVKEPGIRISEIDILSEEEKNRLLYEFNDTGVDYPKDKTIHQLYEKQVENIPDRVALVGKITNYKLQITNQETPFGQVLDAFGGMVTPDDGPDLAVPPVQPVPPVRQLSLTYRQLNEQSNRLAYLLTGKGVLPEVIVGIMVERSIEMIIGILGILKSGGTYLPIDPEYPRERIDYMLKDSGAGVLVTTPKLQVKVKTEVEEKSRQPGLPLQFIHINTNLAFSSEPSLLTLTSTLTCRVSPANLAYIIYTSGTTGKPKGTLIDHRNVVRLLFNDRFQFDFTRHDVWTLFHSYCFDFSVWEMYGALLYGGKLVLIPQILTRDTYGFREILIKQNVTILNQTPAAFYNLARIEVEAPGKEMELRYVIFGGEALAPYKLKEWKDKYPGTKLVNMYGITETTVHVTYKEIEDWDICLNISNIGKPVPTLSVYVMDRHQNLVPFGAAGELYVGGQGVGRGYLNRPELTRERFCRRQPGGSFRENRPLDPRKSFLCKSFLFILYRTGDRVRLLGNFEMEYLGRSDKQVKIRGFRIELQEIEYALLKHDKIKEAVVLPVKNKDGDKFLCAYIVSAGELSAPGLKEYLLMELPVYMIPAYFIPIDRVPLTTSGKTDRKALESISTAFSSAEEFTPPGSDLERKIAIAWKETLGIDDISVTDNYFDVGGNSINILKLSMKLENVLAMDIQLNQLFRYPTIASFARCLAMEKDSQITEGVEKEQEIRFKNVKDRLKEKRKRNI